MRFTERSFDKTRLGVEQAGDYGALMFYTHVLLSPIAAKLRCTKIHIEGKIPAEGPAMYVSNHDSSLDSQVMMYYYAHYLRRAPVIVVRESFINSDYQESEKIQSRTGKAEDALHKNGLIKNFAAWAVKQNDTASLKRGDKESSKQLEAALKEKFNQNRVVHIYGQETRQPEKDLRVFGIGASSIAFNNPDVPIYLAGISGSKIDFSGFERFLRTLRGPVVLNIAEVGTFRDSGAENSRDFNRILQSKEADLIPYNLKKEYIKAQNQRST